jgi:cyanate lyase
MLQRLWLNTRTCPPDQAMTAHRAYRYYDLVMVAFVTVLARIIHENFAQTNFRA